MSKTSKITIKVEKAVESAETHAIEMQQIEGCVKRKAARKGRT